MTTWEADMLHTLAGALRIVSLDQAARIWWPEQRRAQRNAHEAVSKLERDGWLQRHRVLSRPVEALTEPLLHWLPGHAPPPFAAVSRQLRRRAQAAARLITVLTAGDRTQQLFGAGRGGRGRGIKLTQMTHDLHVVEVWLNYRRRAGDRFRWLSEHSLSSSWPTRQRPDAVLVNSQGRFLRAIEYGGNYPAARLAALHRALSSLNLNYEIW